MEYRSVTDRQTCGLGAVWMVATQYRSVMDRQTDGRAGYIVDAMQLERCSLVADNADVS